MRVWVAGIIEAHVTFDDGVVRLDAEAALAEEVPTAQLPAVDVGILVVDRAGDVELVPGSEAAVGSRSYSVANARCCASVPLKFAGAARSTSTPLASVNDPPGCSIMAIITNRLVSSVPKPRLPALPTAAWARGPQV